MHRQIGASVLQGLFQLFDKQSFAADFRQGFVQNLVAARGHAQDFDFAVGIQGFQTALDMLRLPHGEQAFTAGNDEFFRVHNDASAIKTNRA